MSQRLPLTVVALFCLLMVHPALGQWKDVGYRIGAGEANRIHGPEGFFTAVRPKAGPWTFSAGLANRFANLSGETIEVYSADTVSFQDYHADSGNAGMSSHLALSIRLSEPVKSAVWDIGNHGVNISAGAELAARYSTDGKTWKDAFVYPRDGRPEDFDPSPVTLAFDKPTSVLYVGWFATVPKDQVAWWNMGSSGNFTFTPVREGTPAAAEGAAPAPTVPLFGSRSIPNAFFGTTTHVNNEGDIKALQSLNIRTVRVDYAWVGFNPARGQYVFPPDMWFIRSFDLGIERGLDQLPVLNIPPEWAVGERGTWPNDESLGELEEAVFRMASKYKGKITHWEASNEPNMALWRERYIVFLKAFYKGIKRADPNNKVVLAGFAGVEHLQLDAAYRHGAKDYFDILNSHSYTRPQLPEPGGYVGKIRALRDVMRKYGDDKPLWVTEMGFNGVEPSMLEYCRAKYEGHRAYSCTEEDQARGLARMYLISAAIPWIERVYFFQLSQAAGYTDVVADCDAYMGLVTPGWMEGQSRPKDAYFAVKTVIKMLDQSTYKEKLDLGSRIWALAFQREKDAFLALWSLDEDVVMQLKDASAIQSVLSMVGTPILMSGNTLKLSGRPIYLVVDRDKLEALELQVRQAQFTGKKDFEVTLGLDAQKTQPGKPVVCVGVTNTSSLPKPMPTVTVTAESPWTVEAGKIDGGLVVPPGEERRFFLIIGGPATGDGEVVFKAVAAWVDGSAECGIERPIHYLTVPPKPAEFKRDGKLGPWKAFRPIVLGLSPARREMADWKGPSDCSANCYLAWDERNLYFAAEVADDVHCQPVDGGQADQMWQHDSVQIGIDVGGDAKPSSNVPQYDGTNDYEIGFGLSQSAGPIAWLWANPKGNPAAVRLDNGTIVRDEAAKMTRYDIAVPWSLLGLTGSPAGKWMGLNITVNDDDGRGRKGALQWTPGMIFNKDPSQFPKILFSPTSERK